MASLPWIFKFSGDTADTPGRKHLDAFLTSRLQHMESVLAGREWLTGTFSVADILMADVLRLVDRFDGLAGYPRLWKLCRARHRPPVLREGTCRPDGAFCCGRLSNIARKPTVAKPALCHVATIDYEHQLTHAIMGLHLCGSSDAP
jgi:hypothetical protein